MFDRIAELEAHAKIGAMVSRAVLLAILVQRRLRKKQHEQCNSETAFLDTAARQTTSAGLYLAQRECENIESSFCMFFIKYCIIYLQAELEALKAARRGMKGLTL